jgi:hypothetical protein
VTWGCFIKSVIYERGAIKLFDDLEVVPLSRGNRPDSGGRADGRALHMYFEVVVES